MRWHDQAVRAKEEWLYICIRMITAIPLLLDCNILIYLACSSPGTDTTAAKTLPHATISRRPYHPTSGVCLTFHHAEARRRRCWTEVKRQPMISGLLARADWRSRQSRPCFPGVGSGRFAAHLFAFVLLFPPCSHEL